MRDVLLAAGIAATLMLLGCSDTPGDGGADAAVGAEICDDGIDNDDNGAIDCDDVACDCQPALCGDGIVDDAEECDPGDALNSAECDADCTIPECGDGLLNRAAGELCDSGTSAIGDLCTATCGMDHDQYGRIAPGSSHTCALLKGGDVRCWGGALTLGISSAEDIGDDEIPASAATVNIGAPVVQLSAGGSHTCGLLGNGLVRCWGYGSGGRLGYGNQDDIGDDEDPVSVGSVDVGGTVIQVSAGGVHTCALLAGGSVRCWGNANFGRLGYGNTDNIGDDEVPDSAGNVDVGGRVVQVVTGGSHTCALMDSGAVRCWGDGAMGTLGYGEPISIGDNETPASAGDVDVGGPVQQLTAGGAHTCALLDNGSVRCWGRALAGALGYGNTEVIGNDETPASAGNVDIGGKVVQIAAGMDHTCALLATGAVRCWGQGDFGQLGYGNTERIGDDETPASAGDVDLGGTAVQIASRFHHNCALLDNGAVRCWGRNRVGQLGYGNTENIGDDEIPASAGDVMYR